MSTARAVVWIVLGALAVVVAAAVVPRTVHREALAACRPDAVEPSEPGRPPASTSGTA